MTAQQGRPVFLNLFRIRFPVTAVLSILHRILGLVLVLCIPLAIYLFGRSLQDPHGFDMVRQLLQNAYVKLVSVPLVWALAHHLFAGIRYLLLDLEYGVGKPAARFSAYLVIVAALGVTLLYAGSLLR